MKKSLLTFILAAAMVVPVFAEKGDISINAKLGLGVNSNFNFDYTEDFSQYNTDIPFMLGAEFFYGLIDNLSVGVGVNYVFDTAAKMDSEVKFGTTNLYVAVKPEVKLESDIFTSIYLIGQLGLSMVRYENYGETPSVDNGLYLGAGFGTMIKDMAFVELIFSSAKGGVSDYYDINLQYNVTSVNVGYKFNI